MTAIQRKATGIIAMAVVLTAVLLSGTEFAVNNGDYSRLLDSTALKVPSWEEPPACLRFDTQTFVQPPTSPPAGLAWALSGTSKLLGASCFPTAVWALVLSTIFWTGVCVNLYRMQGLAFCAGLSAAGISFTLLFPVLNSFYETAFVIAIAPWTPLVSGTSTPRSVASGVICFLVTASKAQCVFFAPLLFYMWMAHSGSNRLKNALVCLTVVATGSTLALSTSHTETNAYNRIYNGLGWAKMGVEEWPANAFFERREHFYEAIHPQAGTIATMCSPKGHALFGTSYWPTAQKIKSTPQDTPTEIDAFLARLSFRDYLSCLYEIGHTQSLIPSVIHVFLSSDYTISYTVAFTDNSLGDVMATIHNVTLGAGPWAFFLIACLVLPYAPRHGLGFMLYTLPAAAIFIWVGDGFYEFERHLMVHFGFIVAVVLFSIRYRCPATDDDGHASANDDRLGPE